MRTLVYTMVQNDIVGLDLWLKYYTKFFGDVVVFCFNTKKKYVSNLEELKKVYGFSYEMVEYYGKHRVDGNPDVVLGFVSDKQYEFLQNHDWVLYTDLDEFVIAGKKYGNLKTFMEGCLKNYVACIAYEVIQTEKEAPIDYSKPYLEQRRYWIKNPLYNKILLSRVPLRWVRGIHRIDTMRDDEISALKYQGLYLIHLKHADMNPTSKDLGPFLTNPDPNVTQHWRHKKRLIPDWIRGVF